MSTDIKTDEVIKSDGTEESYKKVPGSMILNIFSYICVVKIYSYTESIDNIYYFH